MQLTADEFAQTVVDDEEAPKWRYREGIYFDFSGEEKDFELTFLAGRKELDTLRVIPSNSLYIKLIRYTIEHDLDGDQYDESRSAVTLLDILRCHAG